MTETLYQIELSSNTSFWLNIEVKESATLKDLNFFLERNWIECCGHISQVTVQGQIYDGTISLNKILNQDSEIVYHYGENTIITGKVSSVRKGSVDKKVNLLSRKFIAEDERCPSCQNM